jgi:hypothetical protein
MRRLQLLCLSLLALSLTSTPQMLLAQAALPQNTRPAVEQGAVQPETQPQEQSQSQPLAEPPQPSAPAESAAQPPQPDTDQTKTNQPQPTTVTTPTVPLALTTIRDQQGILAMAVPASWSDVAEGAWQIAGAPAGWTISASPNQAEFVANWGTPGVALFYSTSLPAAMEPEDVLGVFDFAGTCQDGGRGLLPPAQRNVTYQIWQNCAGEDTAVAVLVISPAGTRDYYAVVEAYLTGVDDLQALGPMLRSVQINVAGTTAPRGTAAGDGAAAEAASPTVATLAAATPTPEPAPTPQPVLATVVTDRLNLRSGPSTDVPRQTVVTRGMQLTVTGQLGNCAWLRVVAPDGQQGWVSGDPNFITLGATCETVPAVTNP